MRIKPLSRVIAFFVGMSACTLSAHATDWLQFGYDQAHSGFNRAENGYSTQTGNTIPYHYNLPSSADSAPIYLGGVSTSSGSKNLLFIVAKNGTLLALDADAPAISVIWSKPCVPPVSGFNYCTKLTTGSPAIDPNLQYVYAYGLDGYVRKYQVGDGTEIKTGGWPELSTSKPDVDKGAAGLSITSPPGGVNYLYSVTDGYVGDAGDYQGHVTSINLSTGAQTVFNTLCSDKGSMHFDESGSSTTDCANHQSGIWGRPGTVYDVNTNRIFVATGNFGASIDGKNWGESVLALPAAFSAPQTTPSDSYTPTEWASMGDADLGSSSPAVLPNAPSSKYPHMAVQVGKDSQVRLLNLDNLSNGSSGSPPTGGEIQKQALPQGNVVTSQPAVWVNPSDGSIWIYIANGNGIAAYKLTIDGLGNPTLVKQWPTSGNGSSGTSPVVANGTVYYMSGSQMRALDAVSGTSVLSSSSTWLTTSNGGIHWQSPILVNGRLYAIDNSSQLWVYQLDGIFKNGFQ
jgi:hypothetical protein